MGFWSLFKAGKQGKAEIKRFEINKKIFDEGEADGGKIKRKTFGTQKNIRGVDDLGRIMHHVRSHRAKKN